MDTQVSPTQIDQHTLSDPQYSLILNNKHQAHCLLAPPPHLAGFPYFVPIIPFKGNPSLLKLLVENLLWFAKGKGEGRRGVVAIEDKGLWYGTSHKAIFSKPVRCEIHIWPFQWEAVDVCDGCPPAVLKAHARGVRYGALEGEGEAGNVSFEVTCVRQIVSHKEDNTRVRVEKVWQVEDEREVVTYCATNNLVPYWKPNSIIELRGVTPELDGYHVVEDVFPQDDFQESSAFSFLGCELLGDKVDDDIYLICDHSDVASASPSWAMRQWSVQSEGLYHVRINLSGVGTADTTRAVKPTEDVCWVDACISSPQSKAMQLHVLPHPLAQPKGTVSMVMNEVPAAKESSLVDQTEGKEVNHSEAHSLGRDKSWLCQSDQAHQYHSSSSSIRQCSNLHGELLSQFLVHANDTALPKVVPYPTSVDNSQVGHRDLAVPLQVVPSLREVQIKGPVANIPGKDSPLAATLSTSSCDQSRAQGPDEKQEEESLLQASVQGRPKPDIWNMGVVSKSCSMRSRSPPPSQGSGTSRRTVKTGLGTKSSGVLDDSICPKSPRMSRVEYTPPARSPSPIPSLRMPCAAELSRRSPSPPTFTRQDRKSAPIVEGSSQAKLPNAVEHVHRLRSVPVDGLEGLLNLGGGGKILEEGPACASNGGCDGFRGSRDAQLDAVSSTGKNGTSASGNRHPQQEPPISIPIPQSGRSVGGKSCTESSAHGMPKAMNDVSELRYQRSSSFTSDIITIPDVPSGCSQRQGSTEGQCAFARPNSGLQLPIPPPVSRPSKPVPCTRDSGSTIPVPIQTASTSPPRQEAVLPNAVRQCILPDPISGLPKPPTPNLYPMHNPAEHHSRQLQLPTPPGLGSKAIIRGRVPGDIIEATSVATSTHNAVIAQQSNLQGYSMILPSPPKQLSRAASISLQSQKGLVHTPVSVCVQEERKAQGDSQTGHMNPMASGSVLGADRLQEVCPEDSNLSGLKKPMCTKEQLQHAMLAIRSRLDDIVRHSVQGNVSLFAPNDPSGLTTCQVVIERIEKMLPAAIMQRGDYLYVVPRHLARDIDSIFDDLDLSEMVKGGLRLSLFHGLDTVYKSVRMRLSTNQLESSPSHLYQDIELDAQKKMDEPLLEPRFEHSADGTVLGKVYPGTCTLKSSSQALPVEQSTQELNVKPQVAKLQLPTPPVYRGVERQKAEMNNLKLTPSSLPPCHGIGCLDLNVETASTSFMKGTEAHMGTIDVFAGFDVSSLGNKSDEEVACAVADRLVKNRGLLINFMVASMEDCGRDIFLDRFVSLQSSPIDGASTAPDTSPVVCSTIEPAFPTMQTKSCTRDIDDTSSLLSLIGPPCQLSETLKTVPVQEDTDCSVSRSISSVSPSTSGMDCNVLMTMVPQPSSLKLGMDQLTSSKGSLSSLLGLDPQLKLLGDSEIGRSSINDRLQQLMNLSGPSRAAQPKFMDKLRDYILKQKPSGPLRKYQEECVEKAEGGDNFIFVAPTGSGKTKIFVEITRRFLQKKPDARVVVICPTVPLTSQQAAVFAVEGFPDQVNAFSGENPLPPPMWPAVLKKYNIMVMTPQILCSILDEGQGNFHEIDILVLDEIHHCRGEHPYSKLMEHYKRTSKDPKRAQVLGFTASPANSSTLEQACNDLTHLLQKTDSQCVVLNEDNEEVQKYVPSAEEENIYIEAREEDSIYSCCMGQYLFNACAKVVVQLIERNPTLQEIPQQALLDLKLGGHSSAFENWCKKSSETLTADPALCGRQEKDTDSCIQLLRHCNITLELVKEGGYEAALRYIAQRTTQITNDLIYIQRTDEESEYKKLLIGLYNIKPVKDKQMTARAFQMTWDLNGYRSFPRYVALVRFLELYKRREGFHGIIFCRTRDAVFSLTDMLRHTPALYFVTAMEFIGHGRTPRRTAPRASLLDGNSSVSSSRGMTGSQQRGTLEKFQSPGRHVLVATRAAEEGINVTTCAFVVRYSVTETGIERIQSRGRTRVHGGKFVNIIENESKEGKMFLKSVKEEATMNQVLKLFANAEHIN